MVCNREHQIGLYNGANMGLLKTVFEVNLGLFGGGGDNSKPKYVTVILTFDHSLIESQASRKNAYPLRDPRSCWRNTHVQPNWYTHSRYGEDLG